MFRSIIFSSVFKHFGVDTQKVKRIQFFKNHSITGKNFHILSLQMDWRLQKQSASLAMEQVQSYYTVG